jgi:uncharacterized protein YceH (UPF0502 family)
MAATSSTSDLVLSVFDRAVVAEYALAREAVSSQILSAYFGYCGDIERLLIEHEAKRAIVLFADADAAQTALLLDRGCVCGGELRVRAIRVDADVQLVKRLHMVMNEPVADDVDAARAVFVAHVAAEATPQTLADFFSFCGDVERVRLFADPSSAPRAAAVVSFVDAKALDTALLLDGARVYDSPIVVRRYAGQIVQNHEFTLKDELDSAAARNATASSSSASSSASARIKAMRDAGYDIGRHAMARAQALDERFKLSARAGGAVQSAKEGAVKSKEIAQYAVKSLREKVSSVRGGTKQNK